MTINVRCNRFSSLCSYFDNCNNIPLLVKWGFVRLSRIRVSIYLNDLDNVDIGICKHNNLNLKIMNKINNLLILVSTKCLIHVYMIFHTCDSISQTLFHGLLFPQR